MAHVAAFEEAKCRLCRVAQLICVIVIAAAAITPVAEVFGIHVTALLEEDGPHASLWIVALIGVVAAAIALQVGTRRPSPLVLWVARVLAAAVAATAALLLLQDVLRDDGDAAVEHPLQSLVAVLLLAVVVLLLRVERPWERVVRPWLLLLTLLLPLLALVGYLFDLPALYTIGGEAVTAFPAVVALLLLEGAVVMARPDREPLARILAGPDRVTALRITVVVLGFPLLMWVGHLTFFAFGLGEHNAWALSVIVGTVIVGIVIYEISVRQQRALVDQVALLSRLTESEERFRLVAENASDVVTLVSNDARMLWISPSIEALIGWTPEEVKARPFTDTFVHPDDRAALRAFQARMRDGEGDSIEMRILCKDGSYRWISALGRPFRDAEGRVAGRTAGWRDIDREVAARQELAESEERFRLLADALLDPQVLLHPVRDAQGLIVDFEYIHANRAMLADCGRSQDAVIGATVRAIQPDFAAAGLIADLAHVVESGEPLVLDAVSFESEQGGGEGYFDLRAVAVPGDRITVTWRDVTEVQRARRVLERQATMDGLTGVLKRESAIAVLNGLSHGERTRGAETGVLFVDLDRFKDVNDRYGHAAGDAVLCAVADRMQAAIRSTDTVARFGGDEFVVVLGEIHDLAEATAIAEKVRRACAGDIETPSGALRVTLSVGAILVTPGESADELVARADAAMYEAKRAGRDQVIAIPQR